MRVIGVDGQPDLTGPEALRLFELPDAPVRSGEIGLMVYAATVNPTDTNIRNGSRYRDTDLEPPWVPGMDVAGIIDEIGPDTDTDLAIGDRVMAIVVPNGRHGGYSDRLVLPARSLARIPRGASLVEASTLPMNGLTARQALDMLALPPGATLAVTGAAGALGGYLIQLAKAEGLRVIADASETDEELVRSLGADVVVRRGDDVAERIRAVAPEGVDAVADAAIQNHLLLPAIRDGGGLVVFRRDAVEPERGITVHAVGVRTYAEEQEKLDALRHLAESGAITLRVADTYAPEQAGEAHARLEQGGTRGRLVIVFRPEP